MMLTSLLAALIFIFLFAYLPGKLITKLTKLPDWPDLQLVLGLSLLPLILFFGRFFSETTWLLIIYLIITIYYLNKLKVKFRPPKIKPAIVLVIMAGSAALALPYLTILNLDQITLAIASNHDQAWHASLTYHLTQTPGFSGQTLTNYHYFYDLILSANASIFQVKPEVLLQLVYPTLFATLFGFAVFRSLTQITKKLGFQILGILLAFFGNNLSFTSSNSLLLDQPLMFIFNHQTVLSIAIFLYFQIMLVKQIKKPIIKRAFLIGIVLASLVYLKIYAFFILSLSLLFVTIKNLKKLWPGLISAGLLTGLILILTFKPSSSMLVFKPFWLITAFTDKIIVPFLPQLYARSRQLYFKPLVFGLILFLNYHFKLLSIFIKKRSNFVNLLGLTTIVSLLALFFTFQTQSPYNIIQFAPYATISLGILLVAFANQLKPKLGQALLLLALGLSLPSSFKTIISHAKSKPELPPLQLELVEVIKPLNTLPSGVTLSLVDRDYHRIPDPHRPLNFIGNNLIGSIGRKPAFFADQKQLEVLSIDYQSRLDQVNHLKQDFCHDKSLLKQEKIQYLILADDLFHCAGDDQIKFTQIKKTNHFALYQLD